MAQPKIPENIYVYYRPNSVGDVRYGNILNADKAHTKDYQKRRDNLIRSNPNPVENITDNKPKSGFRVYNYRGDSFEIEHPDGFIFSITNQNMYDLMRTSTITNCDIQNKLFFNETLLLISETSEIYDEQKEYASNKDAAREFLKTLKFGDLLEDKQKSYSRVYVGKQHIFTIGTSWNDYTPKRSSVLYNVYYAPHTKEYYYCSNEEMALYLMQIDKVSSHNYFIETEDEILQEAHNNIQKNETKGILYFGKKPKKYSDIKYNYVELDSTDDHSVLDGKRKYPKLYYTEINGQKYFISTVVNSESWYNSRHIPISTLKYDHNYYYANLYCIDETSGLPLNGTYINNRRMSFKDAKFGYVEFYV